MAAAAAVVVWPAAAVSPVGAWLLGDERVYLLNCDGAHLAVAVCPSASPGHRGILFVTLVPPQYESGSDSNRIDTQCNIHDFFKHKEQRWCRFWLPWMAPYRAQTPFCGLPRTSGSRRYSWTWSQVRSRVLPRKTVDLPLRHLHLAFPLYMQCCPPWP